MSVLSQEDLRILNTPESRGSILARLFSEIENATEYRCTIADSLEFRRDQYGLNAAQFSCLLGIAASHYSEVIKGKRSLPLKAIKRAFVIGIPAEALLQLQDKDKA